MARVPMDEPTLRKTAFDGQLSRREVLTQGTRLGLTAPLIAAMLAACGDDDDNATAAPASTTTPPTPTTAAADSTASDADPTVDTAGNPTAAVQPSGNRGKGDLLRILAWQAPVMLNPHLAFGAEKDVTPARMVLEPLMEIDATGELVPILVAEVPSIDNGGVVEDGLSVSYKLRQDVTWSDGTLFTAEDVKFTWEYIMAPGSTATTVGGYANITSVDVVDDYMVTVHFDEPTPGWSVPFAGAYSGIVLPKHLLQEHMGEDGMNAPFNLEPIGTGPYRVADFKPGDLVVFEMNEHYREADKPYFRQVEFKGGGDAASAARAVLQTGDADYAGMITVQKEILDELAEGGQGAIDVVEGMRVAHVALNFADPNTEVDGARSEPSVPHPFLTELDVRRAFKLAVDSATIAERLYGPTGTLTSNLLAGPERFVSPNTSAVFDLEGAEALLDQAGWGRDGATRTKEDVELSVVFQTNISPINQKIQETITQNWDDLGIAVEIKSIDAGVFYSADPGNADTFIKFYADCEMISSGPPNPFVLGHMRRFLSSDPEIDIAQKENSWTGSNIFRWQSHEFNDLWLRASMELDPEKQPPLFIAMNDLAVEEVVAIPLVRQNQVAAVTTKLKGVTRSAWTVDTAAIANWYMED